MVLKVHILDLIKADKLISDNEFLQKVLVPQQGFWLVLTDDKDQLAEIKRQFTAKNIRFKLEEE